MAEIYLQHPKHGQKVAHSVLEAQMDKANGWEEFEPSRAVPAPPVEEDEESVDPAPSFPAFLTAPQEPPKGKKPKG